jgi:TonB family protein
MVLANILSFGIQVTVIVAAAALLARVLRLDNPRALLAYWRTLLLACLLLPVLQPWNTVVPPALATSELEIIEDKFAAAVAPAPVTTPLAPQRPIGDFVLIAIAVGFAARLLWLLIGAYGLRRLRRQASPLDPLPTGVRDAQARIRARAAMFVSRHVSGPITFGAIRPVVVFPRAVTTMPAAVQEAITCHELLHVKRRDWLHEIVEEIVRAVLWFHPAIWWLIGRIRLTREQVVDQEAIRLIQSRERYVEALLAVASSGSRQRFVPASPFLRRHLLKQRVARILQETAMSTHRLIASFTLSAAALVAAATFSVRSFPLEAQGKAAADNGSPIQIVSGGEHLLHGELPHYPGRAVDRKIGGDVVVEMTLNDRGEVSDARVLSGPDELRKAALEAVLQWHYSPAAMSSTSTQATLRFKVPDVEKLKEHATVVLKDKTKKQGEAEVEIVPDRHGSKKHGSEELVTYTVALKGDHELAKKSMNWKIVEAHGEPKFDGMAKLVDVRTERVPQTTANELLAQAGVALGDALTEDSVKRIKHAAGAIDEHFEIRFHQDRKAGGVVLTILTR